jgi:hypothetical protein
MNGRIAGSGTSIVVLVATTLSVVLLNDKPETDRVLVNPLTNVLLTRALAARRCRCLSLAANCAGVRSSSGVVFARFRDEAFDMVQRATNRPE